MEKNKTIIIISHRSSTIENCDEIFKVEDGKIIKKDEKKIRLNIGSGSRPINGYLNIDFDSITTLRKRYPNRKFKKT